MIDVGPSTRELAVAKKNVTKDDVFDKMSAYTWQHFPCDDRVSSFEKIFRLLKVIRECETWLLSQFCVQEFSSLGHGDFIDFLHKNVSLLPCQLYSYFAGGSDEKSSLMVTMNHNQLQVFISQAENSKENKPNDFVLALLRKQFPTISFHVDGNKTDKLRSSINRDYKFGDCPSSVSFSVILLDRHLMNDASSDEQLIAEVSGKFTGLPQSSSEDAIKCLLKAPMLSDLLSWSHWDVSYAPSLGPFINWLLNGAHREVISCIVTSDGKFIRYDPSTTPDDFLEAAIQGSSFHTAVRLLSLVPVYGGTCHVPLSLLKQFAHKAIEVMISNFSDSTNVEVPDGRHALRSTPGQVVASGYCDSASSRLDVAVCGNDRDTAVQCLEKKSYVMASKFILGCLDHLPSEFRNFAAEILVSGLQSCTREAPTLLLHECKHFAHRIMLHDIGLHLGIVEWIEDYKEFFSDVGCYKMATSMISSLLDSIPQPRSTPKCSVQDLEGASIRNSEIDCRLETSTPVADSPREDSLFLLKAIREAADKKDDGYSQGIFEKTDQDAVLLIESIRREEFGLDSDLGQDASSLLKKQHARLGRALHCLSQELYSQDSHLLLELIQNADDNFYPEDADPALIFILQSDGLIVLNNEIGFSAQNIRALCDIGNSTKSCTGSGYIGKKGIGFKSVFRVTDAPEIHSNGFHVKFDISEGQIGFVLPTLVSAFDTSVYTRQLNFESNQANSLSWKTCIVLPFRPTIKQGSGISTIITLFTDIHPSLLLFLHRLKCIQFRNMINNTHVIMRRETMKDGIIKVSHGPGTTSWLVVRKTLQGSVIRPEVQSTEIAVAFTLDEFENGLYTPHLSPQPVFAFLPLRQYGLKFILQGDFILPSSREEVDEDSAWNQWLLSEVPSLFIGAEKSFYDLPCFRGNPGKAVSCFMSFVPLPGEVHGFFFNLPSVILSKLRSSCCLLLEGYDTEWFPPCRALRGWDEQAQFLLSDTLLQQHLGVGYLRKDIALSDTLARALGVRSYSPKILIDAVSSICLVDGRLKLMGLDWLASFLVVLNAALSAQSMGYFSSAGPESDMIRNLKEIPIVPLSDGSYCSVAKGPIWLPFDYPDRLERHHIINDFPLLFGKLRTVDPLLLSSEMSYVSNSEERRIDNLRSMLHKIGVQHLSAHEIIKTHILHHLSCNTRPHIDQDLTIEYLVFVMLHFQDGCPSCLIEKDGLILELQSKSIILTNHGFKCPSKDAIHFGKEFGNPVDITKLIDYEDASWNEVDAMYLKHCSSLSLTSPQKNWRDFFLRMGVTDFVQVTSVEKNASELINSVSTTMVDCLSIVKDWESPELVPLLMNISSKKNGAKSRYLLEVLDGMWDDYYRTRATGCVIFRPSDEAKTIESSFMRSICSIKWVSSKIDNELHFPRDLYYDCDEVRSILGVFAPYAVPKVHSKMFLKDIGFKMQVTLDDAIKVLQFWVTSDNIPKLSILQMSNLYNFIWDRNPISKEILDQFKSRPWIFVPCISALKCKEPVPGSFFPPDKVCWHDPTGCVDLMQERASSPASQENINLPCKTLDIVYPGLHDFFVSMCGLRKYPSSSDYIEILLQLSSVSIPSQASHAVFQVFLKWADDIETGSFKPDEISQLKESLTKMENTVLPTVREKWVSLNPAFGLVCWCDDEELRLQFIHSDGIDFLHLGELSYKEKMLSGKVSQLMQKLGIHALSEVVSRKAIFYGTEDNKQQTSMINWILPYVQRYLYKLHPDRYQLLEKNVPKRINQLQIFVVENLFYKHTLKGEACTSTKRFECCCVLQGNTLYIKHCSDSHSVFLELSRLFFDGVTNLQLANFLHMITTMAESGSNEEQIDFFVVNSQKVPKLPEGEPIWSLLTSSARPVETSCSLIPPAPLPSVENFERNTGKPVLTTNWPPTNWKNAPVFGSGLPYHFRAMSDVASQSCSKPSDVVLAEDIHFDMRINADGSSKDALLGTITNYPSQDLVSNKPASKEAPCRNISDVTIMLDDGLATSAGVGTVSSLLTSVENLAVQPPSEDDAYRTGRLGEAAAYRYFSEKFGSSAVKWVNKDLETGLPYDILINEGEDIREYVEVKTTKSRNKNWFLISMREWQFAAENGNAFSIARVVLVPPSNAQVTVLKNPARLCQKNSLHLAILMQDPTPFAAPS